MSLRLQTAKRRSNELDPQVLAKLMVLEQTAPRSFSPDRPALFLSAGRDGVAVVR